MLFQNIISNGFLGDLWSYIADVVDQYEHQNANFRTKSIPIELNWLHMCHQKWMHSILCNPGDS